MDTKTVTKENLVPMPANEMHSRIGSLVHVKWASPYAKWLLKEYYVDNTQKIRARLETPKTHKKLNVDASALMVRPGIYERVEQAINQQQELFGETVEGR
ncbi:MAG: hypothetical protein ACREBJ_11040 [Nitrosotalea sp.]